ncbi:hypothetical protein [Capnocytophaga catalasegens]|uniref:Uncharacterized protein n=1 Tax=Capnocytophaga catalasegens TaxID=1004260 RepID=A0AAV5AXP1_9FLAO|nr:hypothetical protein [Capnocytophaga catalasegens]GIZ16180.1 hypothetical protein RCZ03_21800 [Capnocytophaga catalasegens]GJM51369.1 hypothetical protein RCZ15_23420 [Capnocytophaga catalasegens]GJM54182.1 hypothetical protein RCZ16_24980 [Capnocytophaga catalasegens]
MTKTTLLKIPYSEFEFKDAISESLQREMNKSFVNKFSIENSLGVAVKRHLQRQFINTSFNGRCPTCPPTTGLKTKFLLTLQVQINYRVSFKAGLRAGLEYQLGDFYSNQSFNFSIYNSGLGTSTSREKRPMVVDATVYLSVGIGTGIATPMNQYSINYDTAMAVPNTFKNSVSYGQAFTWNSAINEKFDLSVVQRQGIFGFRSGDFALSTNNDTKRGYFGGGTDHGWTGGLILSFNVARLGIIEAGYQNFTGKYDEQGFQERQMDSLIKLKEEGRIGKEEFKQKSEKLLFENPYHSQDDYQKSFNRASNFLRLLKDNNSIRLDVESNGWFQNGIHNLINDFKFKYDNPKPIGIWIEKAF